MADIEKVMDDLMDIKERNKLSECEIKTISDAVALLLQQEAVKPKFKERMGEFVAGLCPTCGTALNNVLNVKACGKCGQAVKWE